MRYSAHIGKTLGTQEVSYQIICEKSNSVYTQIWDNIHTYGIIHTHMG
jgi:hypothetical protein